MLILNFSHLLTDEHLAQIESLTGQEVGRSVVSQQLSALESASMGEALG